jgi:hypothetical protein
MYQNAESSIGKRAEMKDCNTKPSVSFIILFVTWFRAGRLELRRDRTLQLFLGRSYNAKCMGSVCSKVRPLLPSEWGRPAL